MTAIEAIHGDMLEVLPKMEVDSIDAVVTDPPYGYKFMGSSWDTSDNIAFRPETWAEVLRVMKPGAHLLACGGTRTYHRLACAIEDAGFEIRDQLAWVYGTGFAKSRDAWRLEMKEKVEMALRDQGVVGEIEWK